MSVPKAAGTSTMHGDVGLIHQDFPNLNKRIGKLKTPLKIKKFPAVS